MKKEFCGIYRKACKAMGILSPGVAMHKKTGQYFPVIEPIFPKIEGNRSNVEMIM